MDKEQQVQLDMLQARWVAKRWVVGLDELTRAREWIDTGTNREAIKEDARLDWHRCAGLWRAHGQRHQRRDMHMAGVLYESTKRGRLSMCRNHARSLAAITNSPPSASFAHGALVITHEWSQERRAQRTLGAKRRNLTTSIQSHGLTYLRHHLAAHPADAWLLREIWRALELPDFTLAADYCNQHGAIDAPQETR